MRNNFKYTFHHKRLRKSFLCALEGLAYILKYHYNFQLIFILAVIVLILSILLQISCLETLVLILTIALVFISEVFNTLVEEVTNLVTDKKYHPAAKIIKDISAAAVLIAAVMSLAVGFVILGRKFWDILFGMYS